MSADITATLGLDKSNFSRGINEAKSEGHSLASMAKELAGPLTAMFSAEAAREFVKHTVEVASALQERVVPRQ